MDYCNCFSDFLDLERFKYIYVYTYVYNMATKTISIMEDAYQLLVNRKKERESFSQTLRRVLSEKKGDIMKFAGSWKDISEKDIIELKKNIKKMDESMQNEFNRGYIG